MGGDGLRQRSAGKPEVIRQPIQSIQHTPVSRVVGDMLPQTQAQRAFGYQSGVYLYILVLLQCTDRGMLHYSPGWARIRLAPRLVSRCPAWSGAPAGTPWPRISPPAIPQHNIYFYCTIPRSFMRGLACTWGLIESSTQLPAPQ